MSLLAWLKQPKWCIFSPIRELKLAISHRFRLVQTRALLHSVSPGLCAKGSMSAKLEIAVILSTFVRPAHLERSLLSLCSSAGVDGKFEVIVSDDGSKDRTQSLVKDCQESAIPLIWVSHKLHGFRVALCRNDGGPCQPRTVLFVYDGDCLFPRDHLQKHLLALHAPASFVPAMLSILMKRLLRELMRPRSSRVSSHAESRGRSAGDYSQC